MYFSDHTYARVRDLVKFAKYRNFSCYFSKKGFSSIKISKIIKHSQETFVVESVVSVWLQVNRLDKPNCLKGTLLKDTLEAFDDYKNKQQKCM